MFTNKQAIYQIKDNTETHQTSDRNPISDRWVYWEVLKLRSLLIKQKWEQNRFINSINYQEICVPMIEVLASECDCAPELLAGCTSIYRSAIPLPKSVIPIQQVSNSDNSKEYSAQDSSTMRFKTNTRFSYLNKKSFYFVQDTGKGDYLYIKTDNPEFAKAKVRSIFEYPLEAQTYPQCDGTIPFPCRSFYDYEMKIDEAVYATLEKMMLPVMLNKLGIPPNKEEQEL